MPLFGNRQRSTERDAAVHDRHDDKPARKGSLFSRNRSHSPSSTAVNDHHDDSTRTNGSGGGGLFSRRRSSSSSDNSSRRGTRDSHSVAGSTSTGGGLFGGNRNGGRTLHNAKFSKDPSIISARQRIGEAEAAERAADQALIEARTAVRNAREHCKNLEREAEEE